MKTYNEILEETKAVREEYFILTLKGNLEIIEKRVRDHLLCFDTCFSFTFPSFITKALIDELVSRGYNVELKGPPSDKFWINEIIIHLEK